MKIGNLILSGRVILAPLVGIADFPYRLIAKRFGAALVYTKMISAEGSCGVIPARWGFFTKIRGF